jgi:hypothetical protein
MNRAENERPLTPRELLTGELPALLSLWTSAPGPETARALLAVWAGLQRLVPAGTDPDEGRLELLVNSEITRLAGVACEGMLFDADDWLHRAKILDRGVDAAAEDLEELDWQAHELFERLDRASLAVWAIGMLPRPSLDAGTLAATRAALERADAFLAARPDLFVSLAADVADVLSCARPDLDEQEPELWETLLRHRRVEEAADELEAPPGRGALLAAARPHRVRPEVPEWAWLPYPEQAMAASAPRPAGIVHCYWREPGGGAVAVLVADQADPRTPLRVNFYRGTEPAVDLAGSPAELAGCRATIDADGNADFAQADLSRARDEGRAADLRVGVERVAWEPLAGRPD